MEGQNCINFGLSECSKVKTCLVFGDLDSLFIKVNLHGIFEPVDGFSGN